MNKTRNIRTTIIFLGVYLLFVGFFWIKGIVPLDDIAYTLVIFWAGFSILFTLYSFIMAMNNESCSAFPVIMVLNGGLYILAEYLTYSLANNMAFGKVNVPEWPLFFWGCGFSAVGLAVGYLIRKKKQLKKA